MIAGTKAHRDDIQGLRAVGALLVATFHIWVGRVSGGVDVFFTVSGFLLVGSLARELRSKGSVDLIGFIARLVKRLLPASLFVIAVVLVSAPFWLPQTRWSTTMTQVLASTLYLENWYLARASVDYLARDEVPSPLQHYWAMSVQVQALVLIAAIFTIGGLALRDKGSDRKRGSTLLLTSLVGVSLFYSIYATAVDQPVAYFNTFARVWEFALGGLVAIALPRVRLPVAAQLAGGWLGLLLVLSCGVLLQVSTIFPGYAALWPTSGAALILLCGQADHPFSVRRLLSLRPLTWLGDISYALYLWHWPLLILYLTVTYRSSVDILPGGGLLVASILLAWLTTRLVEQPFRAMREDRPWRTIMAGAGAAALIFAGDIGWRIHTAWATPKDRLVQSDPVLYPGAAVFDDSYYATDGYTPVMPGPLWMKRDVSPLYARGCHQKNRADELLSCNFGDLRAPHVLAVVGGSHSAHYISALRPIIEQHGWRMVTFTKSACLFGQPAPAGAGFEHASCVRWNEKLLARLIEMKPDLVFTTATHGEAGSGERIPPRFIAQWRALTAHSVPIAAIRDNPWFPDDVPECVQVNGPASLRCTIRRVHAFARVSPLIGIPPVAGVNFLDLTSHVCPSDPCPAVTGNIVMYSDRHHFTNTYMRTLVPYLNRQLWPVMQQAAQRRTAAQAGVRKARADSDQSGS